MQTKAFLTYVIYTDDGKVLQRLPEVPLDDAAVARLSVGFSAPNGAMIGTAQLEQQRQAQAAIDLERQNRLPLPLTAAAPQHDLTVKPPLPSAQPVIDDRLSPDEAQDLAELGMSLRTKEDWSPTPTPIVDSIRPGGDPRQRGGGAAPAGGHRNGLADGQGNTIAESTAAPATIANAAPKAAKRTRRAAGETPLATDSETSAEMA